MDLDDIKVVLVIGILVIIAILALILPFCIFCNIEEQRKIDLEKYKIEMQYKNGDVVDVEE